MLLELSSRLFFAAGEYDAKQDMSELIRPVDDSVDGPYGLTQGENKLVEGTR